MQTFIVLALVVSVCESDDDDDDDAFFKRVRFALRARRATGTRRADV